MQAKELMIGDWVMLTKTNNENTAIKCDISTFTIFEVCPERIAPIPLTPEILEKNGINGGVWEDYYGHTLLIKNNRLTYLFDGHKRLDLPYNRSIYVHELQNALRLCELHDLADNFKV